MSDNNRSAGRQQSKFSGQFALPDLFMGRLGAFQIASSVRSIGLRADYEQPQGAGFIIEVRSAAIGCLERVTTALDPAIRFLKKTPRVPLLSRC